MDCQRECQNKICSIKQKKLVVIALSQARNWNRRYNREFIYGRPGQACVTNEARVVTQTEVSLDSQIICRVTHKAGSSILG